MPEELEHVDVLIVGAGLSGIGAACQISEHLPHKTVAVLEGREVSGGTWDLFKYPGIRSDSDMFTFGFHWRPWPSDTALADGPLILDYLRTVAEEYGVDKLIRYRHRVLGGAWDSETATVDRRDRPRGRAEADHHQPAVGRAPATTTTTRVTSRSSRAPRTSPARSSTRSTGPRTSTTPASASS